MQEVESVCKTLSLGHMCNMSVCNVTCLVGVSKRRSGRKVHNRSPETSHSRNLLRHDCYTKYLPCLFCSLATTKVKYVLHGHLRIHSHILLPEPNASYLKTPTGLKNARSRHRSVDIVAPAPKRFHGQRCVSVIASKPPAPFFPSLYLRLLSTRPRRRLLCGTRCCLSR